MNNKQSKVTIVGGSGCIGSHTVDLMLKHNINVHVIDIKEPHRGVVPYTECDITDYDSIEKALTGSDIVYVLAAVSDANENYRDPVGSMNINLRGVNNVFQACVANNVSRAIFSSSVWVYNNCSETNVNEDTTIPSNDIGHNYTASKICGEMLLRSYTNMYGLKHTIMRYGIAYGPRSSPDTVVSTFMKRAMSNQSLNITGNGNIYRNFMYVTDHARANLACMNKSAENETINFDGPESITIEQVAKYTKEVTGNDVDINYNSTRVGDYKGKVVSNDKSYRILNWKPVVGFKEGLHRHYNECRNNILI